MHVRSLKVEFCNETLKFLALVTLLSSRISNYEHKVPDNSGRFDVDQHRAYSQLFAFLGNIDKVRSFASKAKKKTDKFYEN